MHSLDTIDTPADLRKCSANELTQIAHDLRLQTIQTVSETGGHLGAGLGVIELTLALHYVFNTPKDKIIWDVGHQTYPHKILTGRKDRMNTLRQYGGLSGFTKRSESKYDPFGAGHSSTSISAALGMAVARDLKKESHEVIALIGDGAISAGIAYEALNNAGALGKRLIVILNDNEMSIAPAVGAMSHYLSRLVSSTPFTTMRNFAKTVAQQLPQSIGNAARKAEKITKDILTDGNIFEQMGFYYIGPIDGHNLDHLIPILTNIRDDKHSNMPILLHVITEKGHGYAMPEAKDEKLHAVKPFNPETAKQKTSKSSKISYTKVFANTLINLAKEDASIIGITAAMPSGTGMDAFGAAFPERMFDVGIAEQHAVTFAAGMACDGFKPYCAIYSTFLQRAYDQVIHDVAIQKLPVRFMIDRAGLVGADGDTHAGSFDLAYLTTLPNMIVMAPSDELELARMIVTSQHINDNPCAIRYPRGEGAGIAIPDPVKPLEIGKGRIVSHGKSKIALLSIGTRLEACKTAASILKEKHNLDITVADARFAKPLDHELLQTLAQNHNYIITVEEGAIGGFGSHVQHAMTSAATLKDQSCSVQCATLPDTLLGQGSTDELYRHAKLNAQSLVERILDAQRNN